MRRLAAKVNLARARCVGKFSMLARAFGFLRIVCEMPYASRARRRECAYLSRNNPPPPPPQMATGSAAFCLTGFAGWRK